MKKIITLISLLSLVLFSTISQAITVYLPANATQTIHFAADELQSYLSHLFDQPVIISPSVEKSEILLLMPQDVPAELKKQLSPAVTPESFQILSTTINKRNCIIINGSDDVGVLYGAYEFIEIILTKIQGSPWVDISFDFEKGSGKSIDFSKLTVDIKKTPFYKNRGLHLDFISLGAGAMLDIDSTQPKDKEIWKRWSDWSSRHRINLLTSWPYGKTNWWELVPDSVLPNATNFTAEQIQKAINIRRDLLHYSGVRAIDPYLMNYVPGRGSTDMVKSYPQLFSHRLDFGTPLASFCYKQEELWMIFKNVIAAIAQTYPEMSGFNLRRWGESYPCECDFCNGRDPELSRQLLMGMVNKATEARQDIKIILSGRIEPEYAAYFPDNVTCMIKWGNDWDPSPNPGISVDYLNAYNKKAVIIDIALPCEESFPLGLIEHNYLHTGINQYANHREAYPNLVGFVAGFGDSETNFLTELNYIIFARLVRDPIGFDTQAFCMAYLANKFGAGAAMSVLNSLNIQSDVWNLFFCSRKHGGYEFLNLAPYSNWARFGDLYTSFPNQYIKALDWISKQPATELKQSLSLLKPLLKQQQEAFQLVCTVKDNIKSSNALMFKDYQMQTHGYLAYLQSREALLEALIAKDNNHELNWKEKLTRVIAANNELYEIIKTKPNNVGYGDQGGNLADWELKRLLEGIFSENEQLKSMLSAN